MIALLFLPCACANIWKPITAYATEENTENRAYMYFFTVDGEEIEKLTKRVSKKKDYIFQDPDAYK